MTAMTVAVIGLSGALGHAVLCVAGSLPSLTCRETLAEVKPDHVAYGDFFTACLLAQVV
jgi:hypothetical protein